MFEFRFPDIGEGIAEGEILRWLVEVGQRVEEHQILVEIETDKAMVELPSPVAGVIRECQGTPGEMIPVGSVLARIEEAAAAGSPEPKKPFAVGVVGELEEAQEPELRVEKSEESTLLPRDRKLARELAVDLKQLRGSGPQGRITERDIRAAAQQAVEGQPEKVAERIPLRGIRRSMARAMVASVSAAAQVTTMDTADGQALQKLRMREQAVAKERGVSLSWLPFIVKALTLVLEQFPLLNSSLDQEKGEILLHPQIHIGFAVDTPEGLLVPVVRDARKLSILELAAALQGLAQRARDRKITPAELKGGTFTVTNYGALGGLWGTPIINPPEAAILGVGRIEDVPVVRDGQVVVRPSIPLSLTFDHRIIDGATAQRFLNALIEHIEDPDLMLLES